MPRMEPETVAVSARARKKKKGKTSFKRSHGQKMKQNYEIAQYPEQCIVADRLKKKRITFTKAAETLGLPSATFSKKLHGYYPFKLNEVYAICDLLEVYNPREVFL